MVISKEASNSPSVIGGLNFWLVFIFSIVADRIILLNLASRIERELSQPKHQAHDLFIKYTIPNTKHSSKLIYAIRQFVSE